MDPAYAANIVPHQGGYLMQRDIVAAGIIAIKAALESQGLDIGPLTFTAKDICEKLPADVVWGILVNAFCGALGSRTGVTASLTFGQLNMELHKSGRITMAPEYPCYFKKFGSAPIHKSTGMQTGCLANLTSDSTMQKYDEGGPAPPLYAEKGVNEVAAIIELLLHSAVASGNLSSYPLVTDLGALQKKTIVFRHPDERVFAVRADASRRLAERQLTLAQWATAGRFTLPEHSVYHEFRTEFQHFWAGIGIHRACYRQLRCGYILEHALRVAIKDGHFSDAMFTGILSQLNYRDKHTATSYLRGLKMFCDEIKRAADGTWRINRDLVRRLLLHLWPGLLTK